MIRKMLLHRKISTFTVYVLMSNYSVFPESISYADTAPDAIIENVTQLGPSVRTTFVVRNSGPSTVPTVELNIMWPFEGTDSGVHSFLYPAAVTVSDRSSLNYDSLILRRVYDMMLPSKR